MIACKPVEIPEWLKPEVAEILSTLQTYPGSVRGDCEVCEAKVWVGPKQQEVLSSRDNKHHVVCMVCLYVSGIPVGTNIRHLGNDYLKADEDE